jgi:hypothetical protein
MLRSLLRSGLGALLVTLIMFIGSFVLWVGAPLLWLWVGSQVQGAGHSLGTSLGVAFLGAVLTIAALASLLARLSEVYRRNCVARGQADPGHVMLEGVLVVSAGITIVGFSVWFFFLAGADPVPLGMTL